ncbi:Signal transduction histidine kinase [Paenibacillus algicola]|uniref:histidine kinase n=1 Tax=Paenibacillus algicola TaxID=2565926 RepID=A0A4P8XGT7_9BACL|nr:GAF domain-containing protein [Paenibacillus algicola]QCT01727.1 Signal transduction histidine kinase [Paenibacillus algicola]
MLKTDYIDVLSVISHKLYDSAAKVMVTASRTIPANTFCIAKLDKVSTQVLKAYNRDKLILNEGLVVENAESYCALVTEHTQGPLVIDNNLTHPLTKDMAATQFVGGCSFVGVPIRSETGAFYGSLCSFDHEFYRFGERDVELLLSLSDFYTGLLEMEQTLGLLREKEVLAERLVEERKDLLAVLSHEIRSPMNGIIGIADLLHHTNLSDEQSMYVNLMEKNGQGLLDMMDQIMEYSRLESGSPKQDQTPFSIRDVLDRVLQEYTPAAKEKGVLLQSQFEAEEERALLGDVGKVTTIVHGLVDNAVKFTDRGQVTLIARMETNPEGASVVDLEIHDTGCGIPVEQHERLFQAFSPIRDAKVPGKPVGVGLGLSMCRQLAEAIHARVWLEETNEEGSCFIFQFECPAI